MPKTREQKSKVVDDLADRISKMQSAVFVNFTGLQVKDAQQIREKTWGTNLDYVVAKKTLLSVAFKKAGVDVKVHELTGNIGIAMGYEDPIGAMKLMGDFSKKYEALKIIGGVFEGKFISTAEVVALSKLPSKQELLGQLVGQIQAPVSAFVRTLSEVPGSFVRVLSAMANRS